MSLSEENKLTIKDITKDKRNKLQHHYNNFWSVRCFLYFTLEMINFRLKKNRKPRFTLIPGLALIIVMGSGNNRVLKHPGSTANKDTKPVTDVHESRVTTILVLRWSVDTP